MESNEDHVPVQQVPDIHVRLGLRLVDGRRGEHHQRFKLFPANPCRRRIFHRDPIHRDRDSQDL